MTEEQLKTFFADIEFGNITIKPVKPLADLSDFYGDVTYGASNGWEITVFFDCGEWDYIDHIIAEGSRYDYNGYADLFSGVRPSEDVRRRIFGEPGYGGEYWQARLQ